MNKKDNKNNKDKIHVITRAVIVDQGHLLLCKTADLPNPFFYLPGGHIEHSESAEQAILRELSEELGSPCTLKRFLGCLEYQFDPGYSSACHNHEYTLIFEAKSTITLSDKLPKVENHIELHWFPIEDLEKIDFRAPPLAKLIPKWLNSDNHNAFAKYC